MALIASLLIVGLGLLIWLAPTWTGTWIIAAIATAFTVVLYFNPKRWYRRRSSAFFTFGCLASAWPSVSAAIQWEGGWIDITTEAAPWAATTALISSVAFGYFDLRSRHPQQPKQTVTGTAKGPGSIGAVVGNPTINTGAVDSETLRKIVDIHAGAIDDLKTQLRATSEENKQLKAALARVELEASLLSRIHSVLRGLA